MATCGTVDVVDGASYLCTIDAGHLPATDHRTDYRIRDPDRGDPYTIPASHTWTTPA